MAPPRRQSSTSKAVPPATTPSVTQVSTPRTVHPPQPVSKLRIHPLLEVYEATISSLIGTLSEDPFRPESIHDITRRLLQCEQELESALEEGTIHSTVTVDTVVKQHHENSLRIKRLQTENAELSKLFSTNLTSLSEARTLLSSLPDSQPATIDSTNLLYPSDLDKIPYQQILNYASKISKYTSPPPLWDSTRPQQPGISLHP